MEKVFKKKAVIFDLDGTIIDTIKDIAGAVNRALAFFGYSERTVEEVQSFLGNGSLMLIYRAIGKEVSEEHCKEVRNLFRAEYEKGMYNLSKPYEGIVELLSELGEKGIKIAVVTNKDHRCAEPMIKHYFGDLVHVCKGVTCDSDRKPNPNTTLAVIEEFGISVDDALFVGDGRADYEVSKNSGIEFIPVAYGYTPQEKLFSMCGKMAADDVTSLRRELLRYL